MVTVPNSVCGHILPKAFLSVNCRYEVCLSDPLKLEIPSNAFLPNSFIFITFTYLFCVCAHIVETEDQSSLPPHVASGDVIQVVRLAAGSFIC